MHLKGILRRLRDLSKASLFAPHYSLVAERDIKREDCRCLLDD